MKLQSRLQIFTAILCFASITVTGQTPQQVQNAVAFSKLFGYVKYFHPSDEAAAVDWNHFAVYGSRQVAHCKNTHELKDSLQALFLPLAPTLQLYTVGEKATFNKEALMVSDPTNHKVIAWQHNGVGLGNGDLYQSARTNRPIITAAKPGATFGPLSNRLDATPYRGKEFLFQGRVRLVAGTGQGQLWVRVDKGNKTGFFNNMSDRPVRQNGWATYEIKGRIDNDAEFILFGVFLSGIGELAFDDMRLQIREGDNWKQIYYNPFSDSEAGKAPKGVGTGSAGYTYTTVAEPGDPQQQFVVIRSQETKPTIKPHSSIFAALPAIGEYMDKSIGGDLHVILPLALYGTEQQTYPAADKERLTQLMGALNRVSSADLSGNNLYTRLGALAITWNIFQQFYPYFDVAQTNWQQDLSGAVEEAYVDKTDIDFLSTLRKLTAKLKDGHINVSVSTNQAIYRPLVHWEWVERELVITHAADSSGGLTTGDLVRTIDGRAPQEHFENIYGEISAATPGWLQYRAQSESLLGSQGSILQLEVQKRDGSIRQVAVRRTASPTQYFASLPARDTIRALEDGIMYVNLDVASMKQIDEALSQIEKSKAVICDLRGYPNGNHKLISYLLKNPDTSAQWMQVPQIIYPDRENISGFQKHSWKLKPGRPHLRTKMIFLTDGRAISYAESYMSFIEHYGLATIVGQPTAGTNGNINPFTLPGGYRITWTGMKVLKHDGSPLHGVGIRPHVYVNRTIGGIRDGRDEFLEKAIQLARETNNKKKPF